MPEVARVELHPGCGLHLNGYNRESCYFEIFNKRTSPFAFTAAADHPWIKLSMTEGVIVQQKRVTDGFISIEAEHYTRRVDVNGSGWRKIEDYGRTLSSMAVFPVTAPVPDCPTPRNKP